MRSWIICAICAAAMMMLLAGFVAGQQGPLQGGSGPTVAKPRNADTDAASPAQPEPELPKIPSRLSKKNAEPDTTAAPRFSSEVNLVTVDTAVLDNKGNFIPGIPPGNFRVLEDNVPQKIEKVDMGQAPITVALLIEFSNKFQSYWGPVWYQTLQLAYGFANTLQPQDYCAVIAYDMKPEILADFTTDRQKVQSALDEMRMATWSEANLYDALIDTTERMSGIDGRKAIVLISSGVDTFSKTTFDETRKALQQNGVPIYAIGLMQALRIMSESRMGQSQQMDFLMADNQMRTFASESGGQSFFPRFQGEFPSIFQAVHQALRLQYVITYTSSNKTHDGAFRKIKVELVNPATNEQLPMKDEKGKPIKYTIVAKSGYKAPQAVE
jgi:Ca-activated chloride channel family protein